MSDKYYGVSEKSIEKLKEIGLKELQETNGVIQDIVNNSKISSIEKVTFDNKQFKVKVLDGKAYCIFEDKLVILNESNIAYLTDGSVIHKFIGSRGMMKTVYLQNGNFDGDYSIGKISNRHLQDTMGETWRTEEKSKNPDGARVIEYYPDKDKNGNQMLHKIEFGDEYTLKCDDMMPSIGEFNKSGQPELETRELSENCLLKQKFLEGWQCTEGNKKLIRPRIIYSISGREYREDVYPFAVEVYRLNYGELPDYRDYERWLKQRKYGALQEVLLKGKIREALRIARSAEESFNKIDYNKLDTIHHC